jgi:nucleoside-diphosphate-sugar epimerase
MKIMIIGGTRFIGLAPTLALHRQGHALEIFNRGKSPAELPPDLVNYAAEDEVLAKRSS